MDGTLRARAVSFVLVLLVSAMAVAGGTTAGAEEVTVPEPQPTGVVAFIDSGINPYHVAFRDTSELAYEHPSTYIPGYPEEAEALSLTLDAPDYRTAIFTDCEVWKSVERDKLYWIPGTKIIGAISFELPRTAAGCIPTPNGHILDLNGHGTMVASRGAAALDYGACRECLIVAIQGPLYLSLPDPKATMYRNIDAIEWAADNAHWIDAQSNSWGPIAPLWAPADEAGLAGGNPQFSRAVEDAAGKHLAFWASGNGVAFRGGVLGHPTVAASHFTPSAIIVGGHDSGYMNTWPGFSPHVVSDSCAAWAAFVDSIDGSSETRASGTSGATPFAAGGAVEILLQARKILGDVTTGVDDDDVVARGEAGLVASGPLADGVFTKEEWKRLVFATATPRPLRQYEDGPPCSFTLGFDPTPVQWKDVPPEYPEYVQIGYGAVDRPAMALALEVLRGETPPPDRARTDAYFSLDDMARRTLYEAWSCEPCG